MSTTILPQSGFGTVQEFAALRDRGHRLLFRVYTPKDLQHSAKSPSDIFFIAPKFDDVYTNASEPLPSHPLDPTYNDVVHHLEWSTRSSSPFISATFSLSWAIWQACTRYHSHVKHDIEIAVIDAQAVQAHTAAEIMCKCKQESRHPNHWKWYHSMQQAQTVLISNVVHKGAVLASFPITSLLGSLPPYFLSGSGEKRSCLDIATSHSFSTFCREVTARFLRQDDRARLHSATTSSLALSWTFLQPWISTAAKNREQFLTALSGFALQIAHWPAQFWTSEHQEIEKMINDVSLMLIDNALSQRKEKEALNNHIEEVVQDLERILDAYAHDLQSYHPPSPEPDAVSSDSEEASNAGVLDETPESQAESGGAHAAEDRQPPCSPPAFASLASLLPPRVVKYPGLLEQASIATVFFVFSALTTFLVARTSTVPPLLPNIT